MPYFNPSVGLAKNLAPTPAHRQQYSDENRKGQVAVHWW